jgi:hypothetical protein
MCTVSILPGTALGTGDRRLDRPVLRVVCSRDERRTRPAALPPVVFGGDDGSVVMPIDPVSGGSWIGANDRGLVFVVLNTYAEPATIRATAGASSSRGLIVPAVALSESVSEALERAVAIDVTRYERFRLLLLDRYQLVECWPEGERLRHRRSFLQGPVVRTSSGLGDDVVAAPRRTLFRRFLTGSRDARAAQDAFHDHQWPGQEDISVCMERSDARTVSRTTIEMRHDTACVTYAARDDESAHRVWLPLARDAGRAVACS